MAKILVEYEKEIPTVSLLRVFFNQISDDIHVCVEFCLLNKITRSKISQCDIYFSIRSNSPYSLYLQKVAKKAGKLYIAFHDDDLFNLDKKERLIWYRRNSIIPQMINADIIWTSNKGLIEKYNTEFEHSRIVMVDTIVDENCLKPYNKQNNNKIRLVFAAGQNHENSFDLLIKPIIERLEKKYFDLIEWNFIGVHPDMSMYPNSKVNYVTHMSFPKYREYMQSQVFDIGLAPLIDSEFSSCKYYNKFIEYSIMGIPSIYSNCKPYTYVIKPNVTGLLATTSEDWYQQIDSLIENDSLRKQVSTGAQQYIIDNHSKDKICSKLLLDIPEFIDSDLSKNSIRVKRFGYYKIIYYITRIIDRCYSIRYYYRVGGVKEVLKKIKQKVRVKL